MYIVFLGPPGVGKGTQCRRLLQHLGIPHVSTGDMLRDAKRKGSPLGLEAARRMDAGQLVSDSIVLQLVEERLKEHDCENGCLFDGFPRTLGQAEALDRLLHRIETPLDVVLELRADEQELIQRMAHRAEHEHRSDDTAETIQERMRVYHSQTEPLVNYYERRRLLQSVNGMGTPDEVFQRILDALPKKA